MNKNIFILFFSVSILFISACDLKEKASKTGNEVKDQLNQLTNSTATNSEPEAVKLKPVYGIDLSNFQGNEMDILNKQTDSLSFIICKATEGITYTDPKFSQNWKLITEKGFIRGAYHFYRSADNPTSQAKHFTTAIKDLKKTDIAPVIDFEGGGINRSQSVENIQKNLLIFIQEIEKLSARQPIIYTDMITGNKYLNNPAFAKYALWIALYEDIDQPRLPLAWKDKQWTFWQKTSSYTIDGKKNDFDVFNGNQEELLAFIKNY